MLADVAPMLPARYRVCDRVRATADTVTLAIEPVDAPLDAGRPGQFNMLWAFGIGEAPISIAGYDAEGRIQHTVRSVGAVTAALCASEPGSMLGARGPFGTGFDLDAAVGHDLVVVGGGIGLAPVRPVVLAAIRDRERYGRVSVLIGARSPDSLLFCDEYEAWRHAGVVVSVIVDTAPPGWTGRVGVVTKLIAPALDDPRRTIAVMCGPEVMMRFAANELLDRGVRPEGVQVSLERNMHCAVGLCGRCQLGPRFVCHDGPVFTWPDVVDLLMVRER